MKLFQRMVDMVAPADKPEAVAERCLFLLHERNKTFSVARKKENSFCCTIERKHLFFVTLAVYRARMAVSGNCACIE